MFSFRHLKRELSVVALLCTLIIFLHSAPTGPYPVVHGPVTALRALQASIAILWSIAFAALSVILALSLPIANRKYSRSATRVPDLAQERPTLTLRC